MASEFDPEALREHRAFLQALATSLLADPHAADDVVQDAAVAWWTAPPRSADAARAWLARVTRNLALNARRERERRVARERFAAREETLAAEAEAEAGLETQRRVLAAVTALREPYKSVVWMRWYEDLPPRAIAERTGRSVETVKSQLKRALAELRGQLDAEYGDRRDWTAALLPLVRPRELASGGGAVLATAALVLVVGVAALGFANWRLPRGDRADDAALLAASALPDGSEPELAQHPALPELESPLERVPAAAPTPDVETRFHRGRVLDAYDGAPLPALDVAVRLSDGVSAPARTALDGSFAVRVPEWTSVAHVRFAEGECVAASGSAGYFEPDDGVIEYPLSIGPTYVLAGTPPAELRWSAFTATIEVPGDGSADPELLSARVRDGAEPWVRLPRTPRLSLLGAGERSIFVLTVASDDGHWCALARVHASLGVQRKPVRLAFEPCGTVNGVLGLGPAWGALDARVELVRAGDLRPRVAAVDEWGRFALARVPAGPATLRVRSPGHDDFEMPVDVVAGRTVELRPALVERSDAMTASARLESATGAPLGRSPPRYRPVGTAAWRELGVPMLVVTLDRTRAWDFCGEPGEYEVVPPGDTGFAWEPPIARLSIPGRPIAHFVLRDDAPTGSVVLRAVDERGATLERFRAHLVLDRLGSGRAAAVELDGDGLVCVATDGAASFADVPRSARGWWLVEADGFQSAWGELDALGARGGERSTTARLTPAWRCTLAFSGRDRESESGGRERALRGVHVRTKGGQLLATSLGDGEARLDLLYDPGELRIELPGWRVAQWDGFRGGKRSAELDLHRVVLEPER